MQTGIQGYSGGAISDQTLLLRDIRDGLVIYNSKVSPIVALFAEPTIREKLRVNQAPKSYRLKADGGNSESTRSTYRDLNVPFKTYDLNSEFTIEWLQDALDSDVMNEMRTAMLGDIELVESLFWQSVLTKQTVGSIGTAYQAGFYNGETDVPSFKNNSFASAHYHYLGLNTTTLAKSHLQSMRMDIQEHGYGLIPGSLHAFMNTANSNALEALMDTNAASTILQAMTAMREKSIDQGVVGSGVMFDGIIFHFDDNIPSGYIAMMATDVKPIAQRNHFRPEYQGLQIYQESVNDGYPLLGSKFMRRIGFAAQHLGAGTCRQLVASTTYTNPTFRLPLS